MGEMFDIESINLHASIVGEEGLQVSVTIRVVPKSFRVREDDDSSATSSLVETLSFRKTSCFYTSQTAESDKYYIMLLIEKYYIFLSLYLQVFFFHFKHSMLLIEKHV